MKKLVMTAFFGALLSTSAFAANEVCYVTCGKVTIKGVLKDGACLISAIAYERHCSDTDVVVSLTEKIKTIELELIEDIRNFDSEVRDEQHFDDGGFAEGEVLFLR